MINSCAIKSRRLASALQNEAISFRVSRFTPKGRRIWIVEGFPFAESELIDLLDRDRLRIDEIRTLRRSIEKTAVEKLRLSNTDDAKP